LPCEPLRPERRWLWLLRWPPLRPAWRLSVWRERGLGPVVVVVPVPVVNRRFSACHRRANNDVGGCAWRMLLPGAVAPVDWVTVAWRAAWGGASVRAIRRTAGCSALRAAVEPCTGSTGASI